MTLWSRLTQEIEAFPELVRTLPVVRVHDPAALRATIERENDFRTPRPLETVTDQVIGHFRTGLIQVTHPRYFGLFNPSVLPAAVVADTLAALYNPQIAVWSHGPAMAELERVTLKTFTELLGLPGETHAAFTSGGAEANFTAVLAAIARHCPETATGGMAALAARPRLYVTAESHHSFVKIARMTGLGTDAIREVATTARFVMDPAALEAAIVEDRANGWRPLFVVGTAGTTGAGMVDPLPAIADVAATHGLWFHVDAAWGGAAVLSRGLRPLLEGIERADSVTWDAHKWLSVSMGAGMIFCRHPEAVQRAFAVSTTYMPDASGALVVENYLATAQWSRRAIGLKVYMALAELGLPGYERLIDHQAAMGRLLRERLTAEGWIVVNDTALPVICFTHPRIRAGERTTHDLVDAIYARGNVWISDVVLGGGEWVLRACITSYRTEPDDVEALVAELGAVLG